MSARSAGYSGTPLAKKLGIVTGSRVCVENAPMNYLALLEPLPAHVTWEPKVTAATDVIHVFCEQRARLMQDLGRLRSSIKATGVIWISWPKRSSKVATDITEDVIREVALPIGLVDVKVCAVDDVWSGLKLVIRKALR
ncbi:MAG: DUF3052 domain-containing protein [Gemmatimonas sp.]